MFANSQLLGVTTPLGAAVSLAGFRAEEGLSQLFSLQLDLVAANDAPDVFRGLLGQPISVQAGPRHFDGICSRISQGRSNTGFTAYTAEVVPWLWLLTRNKKSRSFQNLSVPDLVQRVAADHGRELTQKLQGSYDARKYVVQYRESDFDFISRLMEEEGIYYFFRQTSDGHELVLVDGVAGHEPLEPVRFDADGGLKRARESVFAWEISQNVTPGQVTLWDYCFELPAQNLEGTAQLQESVQAGGVTHVLRTTAGDALELYEYPGGYAERFDGVDAGGGEQPAELQKLFPAAQRSAAFRMQAEAAAALQIAGASTVRALAAGRILTISGSGDRFNGKYLVTSCTHRFERRGDRVAYENSFTCIPEALPYRPPRSAAPPFLGPQTAIVVGPPGETSFHDKYGRVKVRFHWDREQAGSSSSCWVRVAQPAGGGRGFHTLPEVGDEVLVAFEHGDPDQPVVLGSLWNGTDRPPQEEG